MLKVWTPGPHVLAIECYAAKSWSLRPNPILEDGKTLMDVGRWTSLYHARRLEKQFWLPGDFLTLAPPALVLEDHLPYAAIAHNRENGKILTDWCKVLVPFGSRVHPISDWRLRRIDDICKLIVAMRAFARECPDDPATGRLLAGSDEPALASGFTVHTHSDGKKWTPAYLRTDTDTKPYAMTCFGALGILGGALCERMQPIIDAGGAVGPSLCKLAGYTWFSHPGQGHPLYWPDDADSALANVTAELIALQVFQNSQGKSGGPPYRDPLPPGMSLTADHETILRYLGAKPFKCQTVIAVTASPIRNRETVGELLAELAKFGLVERPHGKRKGYALTTPGRQWLAENP